VLHGVAQSLVVVFPHKLDFAPFGVMVTLYCIDVFCSFIHSFNTVCRHRFLEFVIMGKKRRFIEFVIMDTKHRFIEFVIMGKKYSFIVFFYYG